MIKPIKHFAVNWIDGMKISQKHFDSQTDFTIDSLRDVSSLSINSYNFGLLPLSKNVDKEDELFNIYNTITNDVQVDIKECRAITPAGYRIELFNYSINLKSLTNILNTNNKNENIDNYYIVISVNPFTRKPHGDIDLEETPPRHPFVKPSYYVELISSSTFDSDSSGGNYIIIGKANIKETIIKADQNFIPPCTSLYSHPKLVKYYNNFANNMANLQQFSIKIIQKNLNSTHNIKLVTSIKLICEALIVHTGNVYFKFRNMIPDLPPIYMVDLFSQLSIHLYNTTQSISPLELEEMLNYIYEWSEIPPHTFLNSLSNVAEINYNHINCDEHLLTIKTMLNNLEIILNKLSELDYIGQRKENIIVNEQSIAPPNKTNKGWNILD